MSADAMTGGTALRAVGRGERRVWLRARTAAHVVETLVDSPATSEAERWWVVRYPGPGVPERREPASTVLEFFGDLDVPGVNLALAQFRREPEGLVEEFAVPSPLTWSSMRDRLHPRTRADLARPLVSMWTAVHERPAPQELRAPAAR